MDWYDEEGGVDVSSVYGFYIHYLYQCEDSGNFKEMYGAVELGDVSSWYVYMNIHADF